MGVTALSISEWTVLASCLSERERKVRAIGDVNKRLPNREIRRTRIKLVNYLSGKPLPELVKFSLLENCSPALLRKSHLWPLLHPSSASASGLPSSPACLRGVGQNAPENPDAETSFTIARGNPEFIPISCPSTADVHGGSEPFPDRFSASNQVAQACGSHTSIRPGSWKTQDS